jgi:putative transposase
MDDAERRELMRQILNTSFECPDGEQKRFAERTLRTWLAKYRIYGFDGLMRAESRLAGSCTAIPGPVLDAAVKLRQELRTRSARGILSVLRAQGFDVTDVAESTLNFHLNRLGATKEKYASEKGTFQLFQKDHANELCQADSSGGIWLPDPRNRGQYKQTRFISLIDDATRVVTHAAFYWNEQLPSLFDCFRKALLKHGKMAHLYTDNGPCFKAKALASTCAQLGIELRHAEQYTPESKGKIERHIGTVKASFYQEAKHSGLETIEELNSFFFAWLDAEYHNRKHKSLDMTPLERWQMDQNKGLIHMVEAEEIRHALMLREERKVNKRTALIQLNNRSYQAGRELAGKKVEVLWHADRGNPTIEIWLSGKLVEIANEVVPGADIDYTKRPERQRQPETPKILHSSKQYRQALVSAHRQELVQASTPGYLSDQEFQDLFVCYLERELSEEEQAYLGSVFSLLSPVRASNTESVLEKAIDAKGPKMHVRYYCDLLKQARLSKRS